MVKDKAAYEEGDALMDGRIDRRAAEQLLLEYLPFFKRLDDEGVRYCIVGGLAVLIQSLVRGREQFRATDDADVMFSVEYTNKEFAADYLSVYASEPGSYKPVYEAVFGDEGFGVFDEDGADVDNISLVGANGIQDGVDTPDFDVVRTLNAKTVDTISFDRIVVNGVSLNVATLQDLAEMKRQTIQLLRAPLSESTRPQDFDDLAQIQIMLEDGTVPSAIEIGTDDGY